LKGIIKILTTIYSIWAISVFTFFMIMFLPFIILPIFIGNNGGKITYFFLWLWSWIFSKLTFISYEIIDRANIKKGKAYIYVSNHTSYLDVPGVRLAIRGQFRPLAKKELLKIPVFGWIVKAVTVVVDRSSQQSRKESLDRIKALIKQGISILIFAEGTQNRTKDLLQPFYDGAFRLAINTQEPILPLVVIGAGKLMAPGKLSIRPGKIKVVCLPEVSVEGLLHEDLQELKQKVFNMMEEELLNQQSNFNDPI
jgi:1-acyl-sn-glycerol-3-phosphate acyltransferase